MRLTPRLQRIARLLTLGLMGGLAFLMRRGPLPEPDTGAAVAPSGESLTEAWSLAQSAARLDETHHSEAALASWQRAYELSDDPTLLLEIGRLERDEGNAARATHAFELFLERGADRVSSERKLLATRQLQEAAATTARVTLQTNVLGASVELEPEHGVAEGSGFVVSVLLDAGQRHLVVSKPGYETQSLVLELEAGETRALRVDLDKAAAGQSDSSPGDARFSRLRLAPRRTPDFG